MTTTDPPVILDLLARAEKRLVGAIARHGRTDAPEVLAIARLYTGRERLTRAVLAMPDTDPNSGDLVALVDVLGASA